MREQRALQEAGPGANLTKLKFSHKSNFLLVIFKFLHFCTFAFLYITMYFLKKYNVNFVKLASGLSQNLHNYLQNYTDVISEIYSFTILHFYISTFLHFYISTFLNFYISTLQCKNIISM